MVSGYSDDVGRSGVQDERPKSRGSDARSALSTHGLAWTFVKSMLISSALVVVVLGVLELVGERSPADRGSPSGTQR